VRTLLGGPAVARLKNAVKRAGRAAGVEIGSVSQSFLGLQRRLLGEVDLLIDVGANTGQYASLVRSLGYRGRIVSFEPGARAFEALARRAAGDRRWEVRRAALGASHARAVLHVSSNSVSSSLLPIRREHVDVAPESRVVAREDVEVSTVDAELAGAPGGSVWLKMDVQGSELDVLAGAVDSFERVRVVQSEMLLTALYDGQADYLEVCELLRRQGLSLRHVERGFQDKGTGFVLAVDGLFVRS
jgi:FkbM family methyltransferase